MSYRVEVTASAEAQLQELSGWWNENRPAARVSVRSAMEQLGLGLQEFPNAAPRYRGRDVRFAPLPGTPYFAFFRVDDHAKVVQVVAVWSVMRGEEPDL